MDLACVLGHPGNQTGNRERLRPPGPMQEKAAARRVSHGTAGQKEIFT